MLNNLSKQIRECLDHAEDCARKGAAQTDPKLKADFLDMERRWLKLAASYEFSQRLGGFSNRAERQTNKSRRQRSASITAFLRDQQFDLETIEAMGTAFATTCRALGLGNQDDAMTTLLAETIIDLAQRGHKNPTALHLAAIKEFKSDPQ
jgi:hypothetical protein